MRMFEMRVELLAENEQHAERVMARITRSLQSEQMVLAVEGLDDITDTATQDEELTDDEVAAFLRQRDIWFINRLLRLAQTGV